MFKVIAGIEEVATEGNYSFTKHRIGKFFYRKEHGLHFRKYFIK